MPDRQTEVTFDRISAVEYLIVLSITHMAISGLIAGYDPGGNDRQGVACLRVEDVSTRAPQSLADSE